MHVAPSGKKAAKRNSRAAAAADAVPSTSNKKRYHSLRGHCSGEGEGAGKGGRAGSHRTAPVCKRALQ
jgi:hypothetical protein